MTVAARIWEFAALSLEFEEPHPLGVFDNLRKRRPFSARIFFYVAELGTAQKLFIINKTKSTVHNIKITLFKLHY